jgi:hypothetical protein
VSDKQYMDADYEVISMVNRGRGNGGELPCKVIHFIPEQNAKTVLELDARIRQAKAAMPYIAVGAAALLSFIIGLAI